MSSAAAGDPDTPHHHLASSLGGIGHRRMAGDTHIKRDEL
jgi:hypothetical protein